MMIHGIINVYKEKGFTSHDVVAKLRGIAGQRKMGHTGTLDPDAEGVLPVCLGRATKVCELLTDKDKTYRAVLLLGKTTDTEDTTGEVLSETSTDHLTEEQVREAIMSFVGEIEQIPPMYSAVKIEGKKLYELAREGKTVERKSRKVCIHSIEITEMDLPKIEIEVRCSKGTYIRTLCSDIGAKLGVGGCMDSLLRTKVSIFELANSMKLSELQECKDQGRLMECIMPVDAIFPEYKKIVVRGEKQLALAYHGNIFYIKNPEFTLKDNEYVRVYDPNGVFIAIYRYNARKDRFHIVTMFLTEEEINALHKGN